MEAFQTLLAENKLKEETNGTKPTGKFELRKVERDCEGKERYIKEDEDDVIFKSKINQMGAFAAAELR